MVGAVLRAGAFNFSRGSPAFSVFERVYTKTCFKNKIKNDGRKKNSAQLFKMRSF
jgi:hypothetical protein